MNKLGRNDTCHCGSGKKYKKCCIDEDNNKFGSWIKNADIILDGQDKKDEIKQLFFALLEYIDKKQWSGACHATSSVLYVLFNEMGIDADPYIGEVKFQSTTFDHSWIEVNDEVYDAAIYLGLNDVKLFPPVIKGKDIQTCESVDAVYGIKHSGLDSIAKFIVSMPIVEYMDEFPESKNGLWDIVTTIGRVVGLTLDIALLREKYKHSQWRLKA